jgi:hypothetical protein
VPASRSFRRLRALASGLVALGLAAAASADAARSVALSERVSLVFATQAESATLLEQADDYTRSFSVFDRAVRAQRTPAPSDEETRAHFAAQALAWPPEQVAKIEASVARLRPKFAAFERWLPERVWFITTTNVTDGGAAHTRGSAVILPELSLERTGDDLDALLAHELFHVLTRANPALRDRLYALIGFLPCPGLELPSELRDRVITNPDAPRIEHAIEIEREGHELWVAPLLLANPPAYDLSLGGDLFAYLTLRFLPVVRGDGACRPEDGASQRLLGADQLSGFSEQIGLNTGYIIHPEEILADNFSLLVNGAKRAETPELLARIRAAMTAER